MSEVYVVIQLSTTCDDTNTYVTKDSAEIIEFSWCIIDASNLEVLNETNNHLKPVNTPITSYCTQVTGIHWDQVKDSKNLKDVLGEFETCINDVVGTREFSLVTIDTFGLKVQLLREARDKGINLPSFLKFPRVFDLRNEFGKWQINHPESLSYGGSLSSILTCLEVDVDYSSNNSTPPPETDPNHLDTKDADTIPSRENNPSSRKGDSMVTIYSKLLTQLIKKSSDDTTVLTKPYDSNQDHQVFINERSKTIFLSNLPFDTTQSELESWFTQFGARPIAFWTLKNLETSNIKNKVKGISGFAVFGSHDEAKDSLLLNGRALNDRCIEIQPSSTRILDKANELLTPFPPSKNRPRPGDWTCPSCGFSNFQRRTACFRCSFPATSAVTFQEQIHPMRRNGSNNNNISPDGSTEKLVNTNMNGNLNNNNLNGNGNNSINNGNGNGNLNGNGGYGQYYDYNMRNYSNGNSSVPFRAGDWKCINELCQYHNFAKNLVCLKCGNAKPMNMHNKVNQHSVNSAAAAIAAATASGKPLNLNTSMYNQSNNQSGQGQVTNQGGNQPSPSTNQSQSQNQVNVNSSVGVNQVNYNSSNINANNGINSVNAINSIHSRPFKPSMHLYSNNLTRTNSNPQSYNTNYLMNSVNTTTNSVNNVGNLNPMGSEISQVASNSSVNSNSGQPPSISPPTTATRTNYSPNIYQTFGNYSYPTPPPATGATTNNNHNHSSNTSNASQNTTTTNDINFNISQFSSLNLNN